MTVPSNQSVFIAKSDITHIEYICTDYQGIWAGLIGPSIIDLMELIHVDYEEISRAMVGKSVGVVLGSIFSGIIAGNNI